MAHQARNQTDVSSESQIDQNITSRNYYATRYIFIIINWYSYIYMSDSMYNVIQYMKDKNLHTYRQATSHQQQTSIAEKEKELNSDHEVSVTNPVYQPIGYTSVAQVCIETVIQIC